MRNHASNVFSLENKAVTALMAWKRFQALSVYSNGGDDPKRSVLTLNGEAIP